MDNVIQGYTITFRWRIGNDSCLSCLFIWLDHWKMRKAPLRLTSFLFPNFPDVSLVNTLIDNFAVCSSDRWWSGKFFSRYFLISLKPFHNYLAISVIASPWNTNRVHAIFKLNRLFYFLQCWLFLNAFSVLPCRPSSERLACPNTMICSTHWQHGVFLAWFSVFSKECSWISLSRPRWCCLGIWNPACHALDCQRGDH